MISIIFGLLGGVGIFLYGMHLTSKSMQKGTAYKLKNALGRIANNRIKGLFLGIFASFLLQSSTATSILVVGLVGNSILTLWQALGIILGAGIGTTLTVQLLTFNLSSYSSIFIFLGSILLIFFSKRGNVKTIGQGILGVGFLFFGIGLMSSSLAPLSTNPDFQHLMTTYVKQPLLILLLAFVLTALMHNSAATILLGITFISTGVLPLASALPIILGANLGSTVPAIVSSLASTREGQKIACSYFVFKATMVIVCLIAFEPLQELLRYTPGDLERKVANIHSLFNIATAIVFLPFVTYVAKFMNKLIPKKEESDKLTMDYSLIDIPEEGLAKSTDEIIQTGNLLKTELDLFFRKELPDDKVIKEIIGIEKRIDQRFLVIQQYLLKIAQQELSEKQSNYDLKMLYILNDFEHIGDLIEQLALTVDRLPVKQVTLTDEEWHNIYQLGLTISDVFSQALTAFEEQDEQLAKKVFWDQSRISQLEKDFRFNHFNRLVERKLSNSQESTAVQLDMINLIFRMNQHSINIVQTILGIV